MTPTALAEDLRARAFRGARRAPGWRIGAEVELIALSAASRRPLPLHAAPDRSDGLGAPDGAALLPLLRQVAAGEGWREEPSPHGAPRFLLRGGAVLSLEPGGQLELSSATSCSVGTLLVQLNAALAPLERHAADVGVQLLAAGIDPYNALDAAPLLLRGERYARMDAYFTRLGPAGARMMRQTASLQVNLDWHAVAAERALQWRVLNAAAPLLVAIFANSPVYAGQPMGCQSFRAHNWRAVDPARTGLFAAEGDAVGEYLRFALDAPMMLRPTAEGGYLAAREWLMRGELPAHQWVAHLTTLFPEVRPRGYLELRSIDALDSAWYAAPLALLAGLAYVPASLSAAAELLGALDPERFAHAAVYGLRDSATAAQARDLWRIAFAGCAVLGPDFVEEAVLERAAEFARRYTFRGYAPADDSSLSLSSPPPISVLTLS